MNIEKFAKNPDVIDWWDLFGEKHLSEDFIRENKDKIDWFYVSAYQTLSEEFIRKFQDKINWNKFVYNENLSNLTL